VVSVGLFTAIWEVLWYVGWADPRLLPPPHVFLSDLTSQARFFNTAQCWQIGVRPDAGPSPWIAVLITILSSTMRVLAGLGLDAVVSVALGVAIGYFRLIEHLALPTVTLLARSRRSRGCRWRSSSSGSATVQRSLWRSSRSSST